MTKKKKKQTKKKSAFLDRNNFAKGTFADILWNWTSDKKG